MMRKQLVPCPIKNNGAIEPALCARYQIAWQAGRLGSGGNCRGADCGYYCAYQKNMSVPEVSGKVKRILKENKAVQHTTPPEEVKPQELPAKVKARNKALEAAQAIHERIAPERAIIDGLTALRERDQGRARVLEQALGFPLTPFLEPPVERGRPFPRPPAAGPLTQAPGFMWISEKDLRAIVLVAQEAKEKADEKISELREAYMALSARVDQLEAKVAQPVDILSRLATTP